MDQANEFSPYLQHQRAQTAQHPAEPVAKRRRVDLGAKEEAEKGREEEVSEEAGKGSGGAKEEEEKGSGVVGKARKKVLVDIDLELGPESDSESCRSGMG